MKPIEHPDTTNVSTEYWEEVLKSHGLGQEDNKLLGSDTDERVDNNDRDLCDLTDEAEQQDDE